MTNLLVTGDDNKSRKESAVAVVVSGVAMSSSGATLMMSLRYGNAGFIVGAALLVLGNFVSAYGGFRLNVGEGK